MKVSALAERIGATSSGDGEVELVDVTLDSRTVVPGSLFCCVPGAVHDGHDFAAAAVDAGAAALLCERRLDLPVAQLVVPDVRVAMAPAAAAVFDDPSADLDVVGVTGTNGKTTVVAMVTAILTHDGRSTREIGTLTGARTTPEAPDLQRQLAGFRSEGVTAVAMEISSHALALHRVDSLRVRVGVFTNLGIDHLDFHGTQESYFAAKAALFEPGRCDVGIVNIDDVHGRLLVHAGGPELRAVSASDVSDVVTGRRGSAFTWRGQRIELPMPGDHNVMNALLAAEACAALGVAEERIAAGLSTLPPVPGRFETFGGDGAPAVIVDFAHTPDALEHALETARALLDPRGRLVVVFGCGGDRDRGKRPMMGEVACRLADDVVVTTDNPRSEDPAAIIDAIVAGCASAPTVIADRAEAIDRAVASAGPDDVVLVAGKGHEQGQVFADRVVPFDDRDVVRAALGRRADATADSDDGRGTAR